MTWPVSAGRFVCVFWCVCCLLPHPCGAGTGEEPAFSGRLTLAADYAVDQESASEDPFVAARLLIDDQMFAWTLHGWFEGEWVLSAAGQQAVAVKRFDRVYGNESRPFDCKELYAGRSLAGIDWQAGIQRFSWGRLDEFPINDFFNPWDYDQFIIKPLEERKIGVPALSASLDRLDWSAQLVWVPWFVPYRLSASGSRWAVTSSPEPHEPDLPARTLENSAVGVRLQQLGEIDGALNIFHGIDPRPVFGLAGEGLNLLDEAEAQGEPVPALHPITVVGMDGATVTGPVSLRAEAAWTYDRVFTIRPEYWRAAGDNLTSDALSSIERERNTFDYGIAADYRPFEDGVLTVQAQQTAILSRPETLYERAFETLLWVNLRKDWFNQRVETSGNFAYNPEHGASMFRTSLTYVLTDAWKTTLSAVFLDGPPLSLFGRYAMNDQIRLEVVYQW